LYSHFIGLVLISTTYAESVFWYHSLSAVQPTTNLKYMLPNDGSGALGYQVTKNMAASACPSEALQNRVSFRLLFLPECDYVTFGYMPSQIRLSSVLCKVRAPYSAGYNFPQCFYAILYFSHPLPLRKILRR